MGVSLKGIAEELKASNKKVQLIYAFNGVGKTRLSREFKELISPKNSEDDEQEDTKAKILYYNAFTEDLFYWDNDLDNDTDRKLKIQPNGFTDWGLRDQGLENKIIKQFQSYTNDKLTPKFNEQFDEITFSIASGDENTINNIKISKGEESCLIWCVFYSLLEQVVNVLNIAEPSDREIDIFDDLEYIFIDDPVSSLDDNHLIELAVNIAHLIKSNPANLKFIITTHNPLFYNVLYNEFRIDTDYYKRDQSDKKNLVKFKDGTFLLRPSNDSPFSYHIFLLYKLEEAITSDDIQRYHFNFLRNIFEKTSTFLGYKHWEVLLSQEEQKEYYIRIINLYSHDKQHGEEASFVKEEDKAALGKLVSLLKTKYNFRQASPKTLTKNNIEEN